MKILTVFYSLTGNTKKIAQVVAQAVAGEVAEIKTKKEIPRAGFGKYFWGGKQVVRKETPEIFPPDKNPSDYDLIFLGTPVWAGNFAPAIRSFVARAKLQNKKIALFCIHGSDDPGKTFIELEKELAGNEIVGKIDFRMEAISEAQAADNLQKAAAWAKGLVLKL
jgi:flavodoxin